MMEENNRAQRDISCQVSSLSGFGKLTAIRIPAAKGMISLKKGYWFQNLMQFFRVNFQPVKVNINREMYNGFWEIYPRVKSQVLSFGIISLKKYPSSSKSLRCSTFSILFLMMNRAIIPRAFLP